MKPRQQYYDLKRDSVSYIIDPTRKKSAFCKGCQTYVPVKDKSKINACWRCPDCRSKEPVAASG